MALASIARFNSVCMLPAQSTSSQKGKCLNYNQLYCFCTLRTQLDQNMLQVDSRQASINHKKSINHFGRRRLLLTTFVPLPIIMAQALQGVEQSDKDIYDLGNFGFDGLGKNAEEYAPAKVLALAQAGEGAVLFLGMDGYEKPLQMIVGAAEAMAVLTAAQERISLRPVTHEAWGSTLAAVGWKVDRVAVTNLQRDAFYSRLILSPIEGSSIDVPPSVLDRRSVDIRPSDAIALALRCHAPLFVSKNVAEEVIGSLQRSDPRLLPKRPQLQANWILPPLGFSEKNNITVVQNFAESLYFLSPVLEPR